MAGGHGHGPLITDPAFEAYNKWMNTRQYRFKVTGKNIIPILVFSIAIPTGLFYLGTWSQWSDDMWPIKRTKNVHEREYKP